MEACAAARDQGTIGLCTSVTVWGLDPFVFLDYVKVCKVLDEHAALRAAKSRARVFARKKI